MATSPQFSSTANTGPLTLNNGSGTTGATLFTPGASGSVIEGISIISNDTAAREIVFYLTISATDYVIGSVSVPALGSATYIKLSAFDFFGFLNPNDQKIVLKNGAVLKAKMVSTITSGKQIDIVAYGGDF